MARWWAISEAARWQSMRMESRSILPSTEAQRQSYQRKAFTLVELLVALFIITMVAGLFIPAVWQARERARRTACKHRLMQIGLALQNYHAAHQVLPPGSVNAKGPIKNEEGGYHVGWIVQILPYLDQRNVYDHFDFSESIYAAANRPARLIQVSVLQCSSDPNMRWEDIGHSSYAGCHHRAEAPIGVDNHGVLFLNSHIRLKDVTDGTSNTIFIGERRLTQDFELGWASGTRATLRNTGTAINSGSPQDEYEYTNWEEDDQRNSAQTTLDGGFGSWHANGCFFIFGDGAARFLNEKINSSVYSQLADSADGEMVGDF